MITKYFSGFWKIWWLFFLIGLIGLIGIKFFETKKTFSSQSQPQKTCQNCNILLVDIDMLRADALPCYGYFRNTTPNICQLAQKSVLFQDNYSAAEWTLPSSVSTVTSLYPAFHQVKQMFGDKLDPTTPTLAEKLQQAGYKTILVIGWKNLAFINIDNGGTKGYNLITSQDISTVITELTKNSQPWFVHFYIGTLHMPYLLTETEKPIENLPAPKDFPTTTAQYQPLLNTYLKNHAQDIFQETALKKYGSIIYGQSFPNDTAVADLFNKLARETSVGEYLKEEWKQKFETYMGTFDQKSQTDIDYVRMLYDTKLQTIDVNLGQLFHQLEVSKSTKKTITVIMSDHGETFGDHGKFGHPPDHHSELYQTPLIINLPQFTAGIVAQTTSNLDIFPTLISLVGISPTINIQGVSLIPMIHQPRLNSGRFVLSQNLTGEIILQNKDWLYYLPVAVQTASQSGLYNKTLDPQEKLNVAEKYPELTQSLFDQARLLRSYDEMLAAEVKNPDYLKGLKLSPEKIERMKTEGYF